MLDFQLGKAPCPRTESPYRITLDQMEIFFILSASPEWGFLSLISSKVVLICRDDLHRESSIFLLLSFSLDEDGGGRMR